VVFAGLAEDVGGVAEGAQGVSSTDVGSRVQSRRPPSNRERSSDGHGCCVAESDDRAILQIEALRGLQGAPSSRM
jgi:hypothetical protein